MDTFTIRIRSHQSPGFTKAELSDVTQETRKVAAAMACAGLGCSRPQGSLPALVGVATRLARGLFAMGETCELSFHFTNLAKLRKHHDVHDPATSSTKSPRAERPVLCGSLVSASDNSEAVSFASTAPHDGRSGGLCSSTYDQY